MKPGTMKTLKAIAEARYAIERKKSAAILQKEASLRTALAKLRAQADAAERALSESHDAQMIGSGPLWQAWAARRRLELQSDLARSAAERERAVRGLKKAFGRREAMASAARQMELDQRNVDARRKFETLLDRVLATKG